MSAIETSRPRPAPPRRAPQRPDCGLYSIGSPVWPGLSKVAEESGELLQIVGRLLGAGPGPRWDAGAQLARLHEETADAYAALGFVVEHNGLDAGLIAARARAKLAAARAAAPGGAWPGLAQVAEEAGALLQVVGKLIGSGGDTRHWDGTDLLARLHEGVAGLLAALDLMVERNGLDAGAIAERRHTKSARYLRWHMQGAPTLSRRRAPPTTAGRAPLTGHGPGPAS